MFVRRKKEKEERMAWKKKYFFIDNWTAIQKAFQFPPVKKKVSLNFWDLRHLPPFFLLHTSSLHIKSHDCVK
jgi:hypothetical protein